MAFRIGRRGVGLIAQLFRAAQCASGRLIQDPVKEEDGGGAAPALEHRGRRGGYRSKSRHTSRTVSRPATRRREAAQERVVAVTRSSAESLRLFENRLDPRGEAPIALAAGPEMRFEM
jgi:hypothetical protein